MPGKDIHSDVEGHAMRGKRSDDAEPETTETQRSTDEPEVEGQGLRAKFAPAAEVEGHTLRVQGQNEEAPESTDLTDADEEPEVGGEVDVEGHGHSARF